MDAKDSKSRSEKRQEYIVIGALVAMIALMYPLYKVYDIYFKPTQIATTYKPVKKPKSNIPITPPHSVFIKGFSGEILAPGLYGYSGKVLNKGRTPATDVVISIELRDPASKKLINRDRVVVFEMKPGTIHPVDGTMPLPGHPKQVALDVGIESVQQRQK